MRTHNIGQDMPEDKIQKVLDNCLSDDYKLNAV
jgi:hypothetical protein